MKASIKFSWLRNKFRDFFSSSQVDNHRYGEVWHIVVISVRLEKEKTRYDLMHFLFYGILSPGAVAVELKNSKSKLRHRTFWPYCDGNIRFWMLETKDADKTTRIRYQQIIGNIEVFS